MADQVKQFQGSHIARIPKLPGIYAWYYKPLVRDIDSIQRILSSFFQEPGELNTEVKLRYGVRYTSKVTLDAVYGVKRQSFRDILGESISCADQFLLDFYKSESLQIFTRPIYIGVAKNLYDRVYSQHYLSMSEMWDDNSSVSKYLNLNPNATPQEVIDKLDLGHSFALEARVRMIPLRDLMVHIFTSNSLAEDFIGTIAEEANSDDRASWRSLEKLLQLISDPICGRQ